MGYQNQRLLPQHFRMIELCLEGYGAKEVAQAMGYHVVGVRQIMACSIFQDELARQRGLRQQNLTDLAARSMTEVKEKLQGLGLKAVDRLEKLVDSVNEHVAHKSIESILNRIDGITTPQQAVQPQVLSVDRLQLILVGMQERNLNPAKYVGSTIVRSERAA